MIDESSLQHVDEALLPFLQARNEAESQMLLSELVLKQGKPVVKRILYRLYTKELSGGAQLRDIDDICGEVLLLLVKRLHDFKADPEAKLINNFRSYITAITYNAYYDYLRQKYPKRWRLKNKVRYLLSNCEEFALWATEEDGRVCGLAAWREQKRRKSAMHGEQLLSSVTESFEAAGLLNGDVRSLPPAELLSHILRLVDAPLEFDHLVSLVAELWGDLDYTEQIEADLPGLSLPFEQIPDPRPGVETEMENRACLKLIWAEICQLPLPQRVALLLSIRDSQGRSVLTLFQITNTASIRQLAETLALPAESLARMWNDLPFGDATIAQHLGATRQQVVNLRLSARKRLARRMREPRKQDLILKPVAPYAR